jgi:hypothetical protein
MLSQRNKNKQTTTTSLNGPVEANTGCELEMDFLGRGGKSIIQGRRMLDGLIKDSVKSQTTLIQKISKVLSK